MVNLTLWKSSIDLLELGASTLEVGPVRTQLTKTNPETKKSTKNLLVNLSEMNHANLALEEDLKNNSIGGLIVRFVCYNYYKLHLNFYMTDEIMKTTFNYHTRCLFLFS